MRKDNLTLGGFHSHYGLSQKTAKHYSWPTYNKNTDQRGRDCAAPPNAVPGGMGWMNISGICLV
ncbi:hypothetical protein D3C86_1936920 [compost metagenome]